MNQYNNFKPFLGGILSKTVTGLITKALKQSEKERLRKDHYRDLSQQSKLFWLWENTFVWLPRALLLINNEKMGNMIYAGSEQERREIKLHYCDKRTEMGWHHRIKKALDEFVHKDNDRSMRYNCRRNYMGKKHIIDHFTRCKQSAASPVS